MQTDNDFFIGDTSRANCSFSVPATKRAGCCPVSAGDGEDSWAASGSSCGSVAFPFPLQWELGTQHRICKTLNDLAIKVVFSVIFFRIFKDPFDNMCLISSLSKMLSSLGMAD